MAASMANVETRFWSWVDQSHLDGCWPWMGARSPKGYGNFMWPDRKPRRAARVMWWLIFGAIPDGMFVLHHCDNPCCVNPTHLFLGTMKDNTRDMLEKGRAACGERHPHAKLSEENVRYIRGSDETGRSLARRFNIGEMEVSRIRSNQRWKHLK